MHFYVITRKNLEFYIVTEKQSYLEKKKGWETLW